MPGSGTKFCALTTQKFRELNHLNEYLSEHSKGCFKLLFWNVGCDFCSILECLSLQGTENSAQKVIVEK